MKEIPLTRGQVALVDDENYEMLNKHNWQALKSYKCWYAQRTVKVDGKRKPIMMHRFILGLPSSRFPQTDHKNGNGLDNRKANLRICSPSENCFNRGKKSLSSSKYKGVYRVRNGKWAAHIKISSKDFHLGRYDREEYAARVYDAAARRHYGEFARTNFSLSETLESLSISRKIKTSKYRGVCWHNGRQHWRAYITANGRSVIIGYFDSEEKAVQAVRQAERRGR